MMNTPGWLGAARCVAGQIISDSAGEPQSEVASDVVDAVLRIATPEIEAALRARIEAEILEQSSMQKDLPKNMRVGLQAALWTVTRGAKS